MIISGIDALGFSVMLIVIVAINNHIFKRKYDQDCIFSGHEWDECSYHHGNPSCPCEKWITVIDGKFTRKETKERT